MVIYKALIKYGYSNFKLEILEYCSQEVILIREQYYIDNLKPEYNTLYIAGSSIGYKHTEETLRKFKNRKFSEESISNLSKSATGRILSEETKTKISLAKKGTKLSENTKEKLSILGINREGVSVKVLNINSNEVKVYPSLTSASLTLGVSRTAVRKAMQEGKILKKLYLIELENK